MSKQWRTFLAGTVGILLGMSVFTFGHWDGWNDSRDAQIRARMFEREGDACMMAKGAGKVYESELADLWKAEVGRPMKCTDFFAVADFLREWKAW